MNGKKKKARRDHEVVIPPPHLRLCRKHGIPISPSRYKSGHRHSDCARCRNRSWSKKNSDRKRAYKRIMRRRELGRSRLRGIALFERSTGFQIPKGWLDASATE